MVSDNHYPLEKPLAVENEITRLLRPKGKAILSDFSRKELEIINICHRLEGRQHDYFEYHFLNEVKDYLVNKGLTVNEFESESQIVLIIQR